MDRKFTLIQTVATAAVFFAVSGWYIYLQAGEDRVQDQGEYQGVTQGNQGEGEDQGEDLQKVKEERIPQPLQLLQHLGLDQMQQQMQQSQPMIVENLLQRPQQMIKGQEP
ncbi:hypothetical protein AKJ16_DCAP05804 [Drosera capensis]